MEKIKASGYFFTEARKPLEKRDFIIENIKDDQVVVEVAGCGLCHTDLTFYTGEVKTKMATPLILGHEISGKVISSGSFFKNLIGKDVIIPAVLPCGECELCRMGRDNICQNQQMPGNDFNGGFATHAIVPGRFLCVLPQDTGPYQLSQLSVVADAITTPYQSMMRSGLKKGDVAIVIGVGGIGIYMIQHAKNVGAHVIALDINEARLKEATQDGAHHTLCVKGVDEKSIRENIRQVVKEKKWSSYAWKVFEMSGTAAGQQTAFSLLSFAGTIGIIGFTMDKLSLRLSNVMAYDATIFGNWGCRPQYYQNVVEDILFGKIKILNHIEEHSIDDINSIFNQALEHKLTKRAVLVNSKR